MTALYIGLLVGMVAGIFGLAALARPSLRRVEREYLEGLVGALGEGARIDEAARTVVLERAGRVVRLERGRDRRDAPRLITSIGSAPIDLKLIRSVRLSDPSACDLTIGDPVFDERWIVEGAPAAAIRALLDEPTRAALGELGPFELTLQRGELRMLVTEATPRAFHFVAALADRVPGAVAAALEEARAASAALPAAPGETPFRAGPSADLVAGGRSQLVAEVKALQARRRLLRVVTFGGITLALIVYLAILVMTAR